MDEPPFSDVISARLAVLDSLAIELENRQPDRPDFRRLRADALLPIDRWIGGHGTAAAAEILPAAMFKVLTEIADELATATGDEALVRLVIELRKRAVAELETAELDELLGRDEDGDEDQDGDEGP